MQHNRTQEQGSQDKRGEDLLELPIRASRKKYEQQIQSRRSIFFIYIIEIICIIN